jgi:hypothetical protein
VRGMASLSILRTGWNMNTNVKDAKERELKKKKCWLKMKLGVYYWQKKDELVIIMNETIGLIPGDNCDEFFQVHQYHLGTEAGVITNVIFETIGSLVHIGEL